MINCVKHKIKYTLENKFFFQNKVAMNYFYVLTYNFGSF